MSARLVVGSVIVASGLGLGAALGGCELVVSDGSYKVASSGSSSAGSAGSTTSSGSTTHSGTASGSVTSGTAVSSGTTTGADACNACELVACSSELNACLANAACASFKQCEASCATQACKCEQNDPSGAALWLTLNTCATSNCSPNSCPAMGIGDPCVEDTDCAGDTTSCASWCTDQCNVTSDCAGANFSGQNLFGQNNYCILNGANVDSCFPGCSTNADCQAFAGTDCETANSVDNPTVNITICTLPADAGTN